jgi:hypothetical protein
VDLFVTGRQNASEGMGDVVEEGALDDRHPRATPATYI